MTSAVIGALRVTLGLNSAQFTSGLTAAQQSLRQTSRTMTDLGKKMAGIGAAMTLGITTPVMAVGAQMGKAAIEAEEMQSAFEVSFASMAADTQKWAKTTGDAMGRSTYALQEMALGFNGLFKAGGPATAQATEMSKTFTVLAQDLASFHNLTEEDAFTALRSGLSGEAEPLRRFNVYITEASLKAEAYASGIAKTGSKLTELQKIQARASLIMKSTSEAQGDVIRTADGTQGQLRKLQSQYAELSVELGARLLPVFTQVVAALSELTAAFSNLSPGTQQFILITAGLAAAIGPIVTVMGGIVSMGGTVLSTFVKLNAAFLAATGATSTLSAAMVVLRGALALIGGPVGLAIAAAFMAIGAAVAYVTLKNKEAVVASDDHRLAAEALAKSTTAYTDAANAAAVATGKEAVLKREAAAAAREQAIADRNAAAAKLASAQASIALYAAEAARLNKANMYNFRGDAAAPIGGRMSAKDRRAWEQAEADAKSQRDAIATANASIKAADAALAKRPGGGGGGGGDTETTRRGGGGGRSAEDLAREAEQRRRALEDYNHELDLQEAQLKGDLDRVRVLERQGEVRQRTRLLIDSEIKTDKDAAALEAEMAQKRLETAEEIARLRDDASARRDWERRLWEIDGRGDMVAKIERQVMLEERIAFWNERNLDLVTATSLATSELAEWDRARSEAAERMAKANALDLEIEKARLRGDRRSERRLSRQADIEDRTREYQTRDLNPLAPKDARAQAEADIAGWDQAELQGHYRDFVKDGFKAAMDGDLAGFAQSWIKDWASRGLEESLNSLGDLLMKLFSNIDWGKGPAGAMGGGGGINLGSIGKSLGSIFGKIPGFATGGSFRVGGAGGVDSKLVSMRLTPGEMVDIRRPGQLQAANNNTPIHFDLRGAVMTSDLLGQMQGMAAQSGGNALQTARTAVPADRAKSSKYSLSGRR